MCDLGVWWQLLFCTGFGIFLNFISFYYAPSAKSISVPFPAGSGRSGPACFFVFVVRKGGFLRCAWPERVARRALRRGRQVVCGSVKGAWLSTMGHPCFPAGSRKARVSLSCGLQAKVMAAFLRCGRMVVGICFPLPRKSILSYF